MTYAIETWFERDRAYVGLHYADEAGRPDTNSPAIVEWWDEAVSEAVEDGYLNPRDYLSSALDYARSLDLIHEDECANCGTIHDVNDPAASNSGYQDDDGLPCYYCAECTADIINIYNANWTLVDEDAYNADLGA